MITAVKESKLDKINPALFRMISVSANTKKDTEFESFNMDILLPPAKLFIDRKNGDIGKKKFIKKYEKFLSQKNTTVENTIFSIGTAIRAKNNICFFCSDDEYELGYIQALIDYICEVFGVEATDPKDVKDGIREAIETLGMSKKEKKLLKGDTEELTEKEKLKRDNVVKKISKEVRNSFSYDGEEYLNKLDKKYAVDQVVLKLVSDGVVKLSSNGELKILSDGSELKKKSPIIQAILTTSESDDSLKKVIKKTCASHDFKVKEKSLKKLEKNDLISLLGEIYTALSSYRSEFHDSDED